VSRIVRPDAQTVDLVCATVLFALALWAWWKRTVADVVNEAEGITDDAT
jgi:hypothetical protein